MAFKLTYGTMHNPPQELHDNYEKALAKVKAQPGKEYPMFINGKDRFSEEKHEAYSPINTTWHLATIQKGTAKDADDAVAAAKAAPMPMKTLVKVERIEVQTGVAWDPRPIRKPLSITTERK